LLNGNAQDILYPHEVTGSVILTAKYCGGKFIRRSRRLRWGNVFGQSAFDSRIRESSKAMANTVNVSWLLRREILQSVA